MHNPIISANNVCYKYEHEKNLAVDNVTLNIEEGSFVAILGRNGSGKSTLAKLFNALLLPTSGTITVDGNIANNEEEAFELRRSCGMVFQNPDNQIVATIVEEDCAFGLENMGVPPVEIRKRVDETLKAVGMGDHALSSPSMLSGGQKQRVAIAGVLAMKPKIIIFDESTAMLDPVGRNDVFNLARKINKEDGITIVWITHFMSEAAMADYLYIMESGKLAMEGTPREVFSNVSRIHELGLEVPLMMQLSHDLANKGVKGIPVSVMNVEEMTEAICRLKSVD